MQPDFADAIEHGYKKWVDGVQDDPKASDNEQDTIDAITCFSAYMLGACGPDFWTLPSQPLSGSLKVPSMAPIHFDLGHYNRRRRRIAQNRSPV